MKKTTLSVLSFSLLCLCSSDLSAQQAKLVANKVPTVIGDHQPILWQPTKEKDILWKKHVWRNIDARDKANAPMVNCTEKAGVTTFASLLIEGAFKGEYKLYRAANDCFATELTTSELIGLLSHSDQVGNSGFNPELVTKYKIKEEWVYLKTKRQMIVRIAGVAPVMEIKGANGTIKEQEVFWVYFPDARNYLARHDIGSAADIFPYNWDGFFESRRFSSSISKVVADNPDRFGYSKDSHMPEIR